MSTSITTLTPLCQNWCHSHHDSAGSVVHLSSLDVARNGTVTALKMRTTAHADLAAVTASLLVFTPTDAARTAPTQWQLEWLRAVCA